MFGPWSAGAAHTRVAFEVSTGLEFWRNYPSFDYGPAEYPYTGARLEGRMVGRFQEHEKSHKHLHARRNHGTIESVSADVCSVMCIAKTSTLTVIFDCRLDRSKVTGYLQCTTIPSKLTCRSHRKPAHSRRINAMRYVLISECNSVAHAMPRW